MIRFQFLPHYFKYIAIGIYVVCGLPAGIDHFILGFTEGLYGYTSDSSTSALLLPGLFHSSEARMLA